MSGNLLLFLMLSPFFHVLAAQETCAISGTVIDTVTSRPVARVKVSAGVPDSTAQDSASPPVRRLTDERGQFCFERLSAGTYKITAQKAAYLNATYGERHPNSPGLPVAVKPDQPAPAPLILKIMPQGTISGVITDADGDPISHAEIRLWKRSLLKDGPSNVSGDQADEEGLFRLWSIAPGTYYLSALPPHLSPENMNRGRFNSLDGSGHPLPEREVETFYKGALTMATATPIQIKAGQEITGLTIPLQKATSRHITGRVSWDFQSTGLPHIWLLMPNQGVNGSVNVEKDGRFHAEGLAPARYSLRAYVPNSNLTIRKEIDLTEGDADGILLQPAETFELKASVHLEGSKAVLSTEECIIAGKKDSGFHAAQADDDGTWRFAGLTPDIYHFIHWSNSGHYFVKRVLVDGEPQEGNIIDLQTRRPQTLEIVLGLSTGNITGQVTNGKGPAAAATIILMDEVTQDTVSRQGMPASAQFEIKFLAPGKYRLYALEDFDHEAFASKDFRAPLASKSVLIELRDGEKRHVEVPLVSAKESQAALQKIAN